jgi:ABC-type branched-subunit amino acid transport system substrate-binding protein
MGVRFMSRLAMVVLCLGGLVALPVRSWGTAASPNPPIHIGMLGPFTGFEADLGAAIAHGARAGQLAVNDAGGVLGRQVRLDAGDTEGSGGQEAVEAINALLNFFHVVAIIGPEDMEYYPVRPIFTQFQIPTIVQGGDVSLDHETTPYFWRDSPSDSVMTVAMALYAHRQGYTRAAMMMLTERSAQTMRDPLRKAFEKLGGTIVADVSIQPGQTSYRSEVLKVINARPQVIFTETDPPSAAVMFANFRELNNLAIPFIGTDLTAGDAYLQAITYKVAHDHLTSVAGASAESKDAFERYYARLYPGREPLANSNYAYDALVSLALAIDQAGSTDGPKINAAMTMVTNPPGTKCTDYAACLRLLKTGVKIKYEGASGSLVYNKYHNVFGAFGALHVDGNGRLQWIAIMSDAELAEAAP